MKKELRWLFYFAMCSYILYNLMWLVGTTFSYSKNDSPKELIFLFLAFVVDVPIIWYISRNLKIGISLLLVTLLLSVADGIIQQWLWLGSMSFPMMWWYLPKIIPISTAVLLYCSTLPVKKHNKELHSQ